MTHSQEALRDWAGSSPSLQAALEELADMPVDVPTSRTVAMAVGIVMERFKIAPEEAFDLIVAVSRQTLVAMDGVAADLAVGEEPEALWSAPALGLARPL